MKKSLLAVAAMGAFASAAQAQSSVTVYGILDVGYAGGSTRLSDTANVASKGYQNGSLKQTVNQFGQSAEQTSRLGFKGVEDLGGGTSAFFTAEFALTPQDQLSSGNTSGGLNNRQTFVGLKKNGLGQTAIGLQYTPVFNAAAATDPGQLNNMAGNVVYASSTAISSGSAASNNTAFTNRTANTLSFKTDNFAGFTASAIYTLNNKNATQTVTGSTVAGQGTLGGNTNASGWGLGADYTLNKFYVTAAYQALKQLTSGDGSTPSSTNTTLWTNQQANGATAAPIGGIVKAAGTTTYPNETVTGTGQNIQDNQFYAGATYDFGILKAYAQYVARSATSTMNSNYYIKRSAEQIGVRSYITPTIEAWASGGLGRYTAFGAGAPTANFNGWQLGSNYWLSKRTNLYAIYGQTMVSSAAISTSSTTSAAFSNYAIGVRHTF
jgi:predicted porin